MWLLLQAEGDDVDGDTVDAGGDDDDDDDQRVVSKPQSQLDVRLQVSTPFNFLLPYNGLFSKQKFSYNPC